MCPWTIRSPGRSALLQGATSDHDSLSFGQRLGVRCRHGLLQWKIFHGANHRRQRDLPWRPGAHTTYHWAWSQCSWALFAAACFWCIAANLCQHLRQQVQRLRMLRELRGLQFWHDHLGFWHQCKQTRTHIQTVFFSFIGCAYSAFPCNGPKNYTPATYTNTKPSLPPSFFYRYAYIRTL